MGNVLQAQKQLKDLKLRTQNDLYYLEYESFENIEFMPLTEDTLSYVRDICKSEKISCPLYKYSGEVKMRKVDSSSYESLNLLASNYGVFFNIEKHQRKLG